ncbi:hypothetical protein F5878DRAFT_368815 [Lentinula raphanica]|uniref:Uncharacterized protein n=1 Tax=Lentinula raphanica TaxID=153919 RepID=A0AA38U8P7_9AGAR|nr:hypothetical protein F5878DRAFT_368815 [Lentinula raphanica]
MLHFSNWRVPIAAAMLCTSLPSITGVAAIPLERTNQFPSDATWFDVSISTQGQVDSANSTVSSLSKRDPTDSAHNQAWEDEWYRQLQVFSVPEAPMICI